MSQTSKLPSLDQSRYRWAPHPDTKGIYRRRALASENIWIQRAAEFRQLFLDCSLVLSSPIGYELLCLRSAAKRAWWRIRCDCPTIAANWQCDNVGSCWLDCSAPDFAIAKEWLERTVIVNDSHEFASDFSAIRDWMNEVKEERRIKDPGLLCLYALENTSESDIVKFRVLLNVDHIVTDGIGIRVLAGKFLAHLARELAYRSDHRNLGNNGGFHWNPPESIQCLPSPWTDLFNEDQLTSGKSYQDAVQRQWDFLKQDCAKNRYGLALLSKSTGPARAQQRTRYHTFSATESRSLLQNVKSKVDPLATITYLGHAAMILVMLKGQTDGVTPTDSATSHTSFFSPCWMNGRPYLRKGNYVSSYAPVCQALGEVVLSDCEEYIMQKEQSTAKGRDTLILATKVVSRSYRDLKRRKSILSESVPLMERLGQEVFKKGKHKEELETVTRTAPFFLSDGITEQYILREYHSVSGSGPEPVLAVENIQFAANAEGPELLVRMSNWKDIITLSGEWRSDQYSDEFVKDFLEEMAELMLSINN